MPKSKIMLSSGTKRKSGKPQDVEQMASTATSCNAHKSKGVKLLGRFNKDQLTKRLEPMPRMEEIQLEELEKILTILILKRCNYRS